MQNYSTRLDQTTWGIHLNFEDTSLPHRTILLGLLNFSNKTGSDEELSYGMQIIALLLIYMRVMDLNFLNTCTTILCGRRKVWSSARQLSSSLPMVQTLHQQKLGGGMGAEKLNRT